ncbi:hypothetical protein Cfor_12113 [Coptotermes formosanus]|uniref:Protein Wnt n=1 Tax=Coptotermes formosanus TaxID=36987 RepID=A0A6L2PKL8_COPFO|nr:hypothetical protein Cfor_12113 [Coptotermes formosanus]
MDCSASLTPEGILQIQCYDFRALRKAGFQWNMTGASSSMCRKARVHFGLVRRQTKLCRTTTQAMPHIVKAAAQTVATCQSTREQAYVYALSSAAVAYTIARACSAGTLFHCSCASPPRDPPNGNFKWGGCGDNVRWGSQFGKQFTDSAEKRGARAEPRSTLAAVNLHNNRAGRRAVESSLLTQCKCHGVSGSCNIKTCWRALPTLTEIGERLKRKFAVATEVISRTVGAGRKLLPASSAMGLYNEDDLIYVTKSPDYCLRDARVGSLGTRGR